MFRTHNSRARRAERVAGQAWSNLVAAVGDAGTAARSATRRTMHTADGMGGRVGGVTQEARRRASLAYDALAGRPAPRPWAWLAAAGVVGVVVGWAGTVFGRQLAVRGDELALQHSVDQHGAPRNHARIP
jgi:hypothetical protein